MNLRIALLVLSLGVLLGVPGVVRAKSEPDSLVMDRLFSYKRNLAPDLAGVERDFYLKYTFRYVRRNFTLVFVPSMHAIAHGERNYIGENIGRIRLRSITDYDIEQRTVSSTIPRNRGAMSVMMRYIVPDLYGQSLFGDYILSPFCRDNRVFYRYRIADVGQGRVTVTFRPRVNNTQLISGTAVVDRLTGRIQSVKMRGEHDMVSFEVSAQMGDGDTPYALLPRRCDSKATFRFMGNEVRTRFFVNFDCDVTPPDSIAGLAPKQQMDCLRPDPLEPMERDIYAQSLSRDTASIDTTAHREPSRARKLADKTWDILSDHVLSSHDANAGNASLRLSPLFNPLYLSYGGSRGLAYKMDIGARYDFTANRSLAFNPTVGYSFKVEQFYFNMPLRYTFNARRKGWIELSWANGNRITNSAVLETIREQSRDTVNFDALGLDYFDDQLVSLTANYSLSRHFELSLGCVFHERKAVNRAEMEQRGQSSAYRSFAPSVKVTVTPVANGPTLMANYERSLKGLFGSNIEYERYEFDASWKIGLSRLRQVNLRGGGGFYTNKSTDYFVDFANFHADYIPGGWDDDWSGDFQLLNSQWYNASQYYVRANASYESPLLALTWIPFVGRYIETERLYASFLQIEHTRPYSELGYGLTNRYFSFGVFASFLNGEFNEIGARFAFELFRKW